MANGRLAHGTASARIRPNIKRPCFRKQQHGAVKAMFDNRRKHRHADVSAQRHGPEREDSERGPLTSITDDAGIGFEVAKQLLRRGHEVILACRDPARAAAACEKLRQASSSSSSSSNISSVQCDLASLASVRACAQQVTEKWPRLDVLVCNAATITAEPVVTSDDFDSMHQVNHVSQFLLTHLLLPRLALSDAGRIVVVGSQTYTNVPADLADPMFFHKIAQQQRQGTSAATAAPKKATAMQRYALTKLYNLWFVKHLAQQLSGNSSTSSSSSNIVVNAVSPGFVPTTELSRYAGLLARLGMQYIMAWAPFAVTAQEGGSRVAALCDGECEGHTNGAYYNRRAVTETLGPADDAQLAAQLWQQTCKDVGVEQYMLLTQQ